MTCLGPSKQAWIEKLWKYRVGKTYTTAPLLLFLFAHPYKLRAWHRLNLKTMGLMDLQVNTLFCSKHYTWCHINVSNSSDKAMRASTWPNNSTAATLTGILELTRNELPCWRTKWDTVHEWTSSLKDLNNIHTQPIDESHWKFLRGEKDLIKTYYQ